MKGQCARGVTLDSISDLMMERNPRAKPVLRLRVESRTRSLDISPSKRLAHADGIFLISTSSELKQCSMSC
jgi:hypothetical protein